MEPMPPSDNNQGEEQIKFSAPPPNAPTADDKSNQFKLASSEVQGPQGLSINPTVQKSPIGIIVASIIVILLLAAGAYLVKTKIFNPSASSTPAAVLPTPTPDPNLDSDNDGISDRIEAIIGTNPDKMDTDEDSYNDLSEIKNGYSPLVDGAAGKYTPEQWQALKDIIKAADEKFYESVFGKEVAENTDNIVTKKCEFPEKIGSYDRQVISDIPNDTNAPAGIKSGKMISYDGWNLSYFLIFNSVDNAKSHLDKTKKEDYADCEIADIKGYCKYKQSSGAGSMINVEGDFAWLEDKTVKIVTNLIMDGLNESVASKEERAKGKLTLFATQFKNCEVK